MTKVCLAVSSIAIFRQNQEWRFFAIVLCTASQILRIHTQKSILLEAFVC